MPAFCSLCTAFTSLPLARLTYRYTVFFNSFSPHLPHKQMRRLTDTTWMCTRKALHNWESWLTGWLAVLSCVMLNVIIKYNRRMCPYILCVRVYYCVYYYYTFISFALIFLSRSPLSPQTSLSTSILCFAFCSFFLFLSLCSLCTWWCWCSCCCFFLFFFIYSFGGFCSVSPPLLVFRTVHFHFTETQHDCILTSVCPCYSRASSYTWNGSMTAWAPPATTWTNGMDQEESAQKFLQQTKKKKQNYSMRNAKLKN